ncbi:MAG: HlyC/CorC family transporter [Nitrospinae bacterium]|nr:HlyC/CorC family transporter [Nitrospinota bacterium]
MMELPVTLILVTICVVMEGFFSGTELALISLNRHRLAHLIEQKDSAALLLERQFKNPANLYATTSIGTNLFVVTGTAIMTAYVSRLDMIDPDLWTVLIMSPVTLLFGEIFPKALFQMWADRISYLAVYPLALAQKLFTPVLWITAGGTKALMRIAGVEEGHDIREVSLEEIRHILRVGDKKLDLHPDEQKMINRIFGLRNITVEQCMVPLIHLTAVERNEPMESVRRKFEETRFSRMPVFSERFFNIIGIVNAFDILRYGSAARTAAPITRPAFYVYKKKKVDDLLSEMQQTGVQMAVVVNEYSDAIGIVTREDMVEEIFGEIEDEYDREQESPQARETAPNRWVADGTAEIDHLNDRFGLNLPLGDYETLAGYILTSLDHIPRKGETVTLELYSFLIREATERGLKQVEITRNPAVQA